MTQEKLNIANNDTKKLLSPGFLENGKENSYETFVKVSYSLHFDF